MPDYQVYVVDDAGRILAAPEVVTCDDDQRALRKAKSLANGHDLEVWQGARIVGRIESAVLRSRCRRPMDRQKVRSQSSNWSNGRCMVGQDRPTLGSADRRSSLNRNCTKIASEPILHAETHP
jgi:hypothetical protein